MHGRALVLGGGGVAGIAWLTGLIKGLDDEGVDLLDADLILGTSAGASAAAQITSGIGFDALYLRQVDPAHQVDEPLPDPDLQARAIAMRPTFLAAGNPDAITRARCAYALSVDTVAEADRKAVIAARLPSHDWPAHAVKLVAVDCADGTMRLFDRASGVGLVDAVTASSAVPGVWPAATIEGRRYTDGGVRSPENIDLAAGHATVLVISPVGAAYPTTPPRDLDADVDSLRATGAQVMLVVPDAASRTAISNNLLDPATRRPAAEAGRMQGRAAANAIQAFWKDPR